MERLDAEFDAQSQEAQQYSYRGWDVAFLIDSPSNGCSLAGRGEVTHAGLHHCNLLMMGHKGGRTSAVLSMTAFANRSIDQWIAEALA